MMLESLGFGAIGKWGVAPAFIIAATVFDPAVMVPVVVASVTVFGGWLGVRQQRNEKKIDATGTLIDNLQEDARTAREMANLSATQLSGILDELNRVKSELALVRATHSIMQVGAASLIAQLEANDIPPMWKPPPPTTPKA